MRAMMATRFLVVLFYAVTATAADATFTGEFKGHGRQCDGRLSITARTIAWHTPFAKCGKHRYSIVKNDLKAAKPKIVYSLKGSACDFGVIALSWDAAYPDYWQATGYRSLNDYKRGSEDPLACSLEKLPPCHK